MGRSPPLPHHPQRRRQRGTAGAQHAGRSSLINIKRDDALLHLLTGHYRSPPLPHHPQRRRQRGTAGAQHAGRSGLINIKRDDALLHLLTGHYRGSGNFTTQIETTPSHGSASPCSENRSVWLVHGAASPAMGLVVATGSPKLALSNGTVNRTCATWSRGEDHA